MNTKYIKRTVTASLLFAITACGEVQEKKPADPMVQSWAMISGEFVLPSASRRSHENPVVILDIHENNMFTLKLTTPDMDFDIARGDYSKEGDQITFAFREALEFDGSMFGVSIPKNTLSSLTLRRSAEIKGNNLMLATHNSQGYGRRFDGAEFVNYTFFNRITSEGIEILGAGPKAYKGGSAIANEVAEFYLNTVKLVFSEDLSSGHISEDKKERLACLESVLIPGVRENGMKGYALYTLMYAGIFKEGMFPRQLSKSRPVFAPIQILMSNEPTLEDEIDATLKEWEKSQGCEIELL